MSAKELNSIPRKEMSMNKSSSKPKKQVEKVQKKEIVEESRAELNMEIYENMETIAEHVQNIETNLNNFAQIISKHDDEITKITGLYVRLSDSITTELSSFAESIAKAIEVGVDARINAMLEAAEESEEEEFEDEENIEETPEE